MSRHALSRGSTTPFQPPLAPRAGNNPRSMCLKKSVCSHVVLALALALTGAMAFAQQDGASIYKAKCQSCHGANGIPNPGIAKLMGVKPVTDPEIKKLTEAQVIATIKNGKGKMKPVAGISDAAAKAAATFFKTLK